MRCQHYIARANCDAHTGANLGIRQRHFQLQVIRTNAAQHCDRSADRRPDAPYPRNRRCALMFHFGGMPHKLALASMKRFAENVAPAFR